MWVNSTSIILFLDIIAYYTYDYIKKNNSRRGIYLVIMCNSNVYPIIGIHAMNF